MKYINRELSWLSFNERVLHEAIDNSVPLTERMRFLGIYSNNMDEFFRVRVAHLKRIIKNKNNKVQGYKGSAEHLFSEIREVVLKQQAQFEQAYELIKTDFEKENIYLINEKQITPLDILVLDAFFHEKLKHVIFPIMLDKKLSLPKFRDDAIYLGIKLHLANKSKYALIQIPNEYGRFFIIEHNLQKKVILIDDIIRLYLNEIFSVVSTAKSEAFTFKFTRDAELDLDDDVAISFFEKIEKSVKNRKFGLPVRFVYDQTIPKDLLEFLLSKLILKKGENTIPGGRYHNFKDFMNFPDFNMPKFRFDESTPSPHPLLMNSTNIIEIVDRQDILLHFPYQKFDHIIDLLREASLNSQVKEIKINIYRVAKNSKVMNALLACLYNGKKVTVVFELQARFDEENNLWWSNKLKEYGARIIYGLPGLKVHSKLLQIQRNENGKTQYTTYIGTGNFNERTANIYTDLGLLTSDKEISSEVMRVFRMLENNIERHTFRRLMVSPFNTRRKILSLIDREIKFAKAKKKAEINIKLNNLTDIKLIDKLYAASKAGVKIKLIIRGICALIPGQKGLSENIEAISIVDRFLEHARFFSFSNNGQKEYYLSSADWMERNLDQRIEVGVVIKSLEIQKELDLIFDYQLKGSVKARNISANYKNTYVKRNLPFFHSQQQLIAHYKAISKKITQ